MENMIKEKGDMINENEELQTQGDDTNRRTRIDALRQMKEDIRH